MREPASCPKVRMPSGKLRLVVSIGLGEVGRESREGRLSRGMD